MARKLRSVLTWLLFPALAACSAGGPRPTDGATSVDNGPDAVADRVTAADATDDFPSGPDLVDGRTTDESAADLPDLHGELHDLLDSTDLPELLDSTELPELLDSTELPDLALDVGTDLADAWEVSDTVGLDLGPADLVPDAADALDPDSEDGKPPPGDKCTEDEECADQDDGNACNGVLVCLAGECVLDPAGPPDCPATGDPCQVNACLPAYGECIVKPAADGIPCSDGNPHTLLDLCLDGLCVGLAASACASNEDCDDLYECTEEVCLEGHCEVSPVVCVPETETACYEAICVPESGCETWNIESSDKVLYSEDFTDGLAQGWPFHQAGFAFLVEPAPSGAHGLAIGLGGGKTVSAFLPPLFLPALDLSLALSLEMWQPDACAAITLQPGLNGLPLASASACDVLAAEGQWLVSLPPGTAGDVALSLTVTNGGEETVKVLLTATQVSFAGGVLCCLDNDEDGVVDCLDNCVDFGNPDQADCDGDGVGDLCDEDADSDGVENKYDAFVCDPGSALTVRRIATRALDAILPRAVACSEELPGCYLFGEEDVLVLTPAGLPVRSVTFPGLGKARSATFCGGLLRVLDVTAEIRFFDVSAPAQPVAAGLITLPQELFSLQQALGCHQGIPLVSAYKAIYSYTDAGETELYLDVLEEVQAMAGAASQLVVVTRSPQAPYLFLVRFYDDVGEETGTLVLKSDPDEEAPTCLYLDGDMAMWGSSAEAGGLWTVSGSCDWPTLQLRDPWHAVLGNGDLDGDGLDDLLDPDDDGDGVADLADWAPLDPFSQADADADGRGNFEDPDDDGDGRSDNFAALGPVAVTLWGTVPEAATGLAWRNGGPCLATAGGGWSCYDDQGDLVESGPLPPGTVNGFAWQENLQVVHEAQSRGLFLLEEGEPVRTVDSPDQAWNVQSAVADVAIAPSGMWVATSGSGRLSFLDDQGNVRFAVRLPGVARGVAAAGEGAAVLLALDDNQSVLLLLHAHGGLAGYLPVPQGGLRSLCRVGEGSFATLHVEGGQSSVLLLEGMAGWEAAALPAVDWGDWVPNSRSVVPIELPLASSESSVTLSWQPFEPEPGEELSLCHVCGGLAGPIPTDSCAPVEAAGGSATVAGLVPGAQCAFELRLASDTGSQASRRAVATVGLSGGEPLWLTPGGATDANWRLVVVPRVLALP